MKRLLLILVFLPLFSFGQNYSLHIDTLINKVNIDTLTKYVRNLSGEDDVVVNGQTVRISHRIDELGNELAGDYIKQELERTGITVQEKLIGSRCRSFLAYQFGDTNPDEYYIICAHYDAIPYFAADDNASGTAAVMEAARILSNYDFPFTIIYALWDQEEIGLVASYNYNYYAYQDGLDIKGVINLDMIAYNSTTNNRFDIHIRPVAQSTYLGYYFYNLCSIYNLSLTPMIVNPGNRSSDHRAFWDYGYNAVFLSEPFDQEYFNPYYHTDEDRISIFDMEFFHEMAKISLGGLASLANGESFTSINEYNIDEYLSLKIYPNPVQQNGLIELELNESSEIILEIYNIDGIKLLSLEDDLISPATYTYKIQDLHLYSGVYFVKLQSKWGIKTEKFIYLK